MLVFYLKRCALIIFISAITFITKAQQDHFIYLQTENSKPFYVKLDNKVVSSSITGYLIISKLIDSDYNISVGFPKNEFPEENFKITIDKKDQGFLLKNFDDKGWGLFNMQSYAVTMGVTKNNFDTSSKNLQSDPFSKMLARVVKDSSILQKNEHLPETILPTKVDSPAVLATPATISDTTISIKQQSVLDFQIASYSSITKLLSNKNEDGLEATYVDVNTNKGDTIRVFIPAEKQIVSDSNTNKTVVQNEHDLKQNEHSEKPLITDSSSINVKQKNPVVDDSTNVTTPISLSYVSSSLNKDTTINQLAMKPKGPDTSVAKDSTINKEIEKNDTAKTKITELTKVVTSTTNSDCKALAANEDFLKLRKKMAAENSDDEMIKTATKAFHSKCFSTEQVKNLSFLFLTDKAKYMFFDTAYPFVSDSDQYFTLQSQISDSYYANRFKAMVNK